MFHENRVLAKMDLVVSKKPIFLPSLIEKSGKKTAKRFLEFFTVNIRNHHTREAYMRAISEFLKWGEAKCIPIQKIEPIMVSAYIENHPGSKSTVKQHLSAIKMLFDWLVTGQIMPVNPAASVRGPKHVVKRGKTPVLSPEEARLLLDSIETDSVVGLRDRALIGVMLYAFARVGAVVGMNVSDYYPLGKRWWFRLHEKGGKFHEMPAHHKAEAFMDAYIVSTGIKDKKKKPLFRTAFRKTKTLTQNRMSRMDAWRMVLRRAHRVRIYAPIGCHTFRATGITNYLENGGTLEKAQTMAAHESARTTKLYDRTQDKITLDEVEKIQI